MRTLTRTKPTLTTLAAFALTALMATSALAKPKGDPRAQVDKTYEAIKAKSDKAKDEDTLREDVTKILDSMVDWDAFSEKTMTTTLWKGFTDEQKSRFKDAYRRLIVKKYARRFKPQSTFRVEVRGKTEFGKDGDLAWVKTTVHTTDKGKPIGVDVDYLFVPVDGGKRWGTADIVTDGVSRARTYRPKFKAIFNKHGFDRLIAAIEKNVKKKDDDD